MTAKEKAQELVNKYHHSEGFLYHSLYGDGMNVQQAEKCALICVDEIMKIGLNRKEYVYWSDVKHEIHNL